jgi:hypothetical protein
MKDGIVNFRSDPGSWEYEADKNKEIAAAADRLKEIQLADPLAYEQAMGLIDNESFDKDALGELVSTVLLESDGITFDLVPQRKVTMRDGQVTVTGDGYITEANLLNSLKQSNSSGANYWTLGFNDTPAEDVIDALLDQGLLKKHPKKNSNDEVVYKIPNLAYKSNAERNTIQSEFDKDYYDKSLTPDQQNVVTADYDARISRIGNKEAARNAFMHAMDSKLRGYTDVYETEMDIFYNGRFGTEGPTTEQMDVLDKYLPLIEAARKNPRNTAVNSRRLYREMMGLL